MGRGLVNDLNLDVKEQKIGLPEFKIVKSAFTYKNQSFNQ